MYDDVSKENYFELYKICWLNKWIYLTFNLQVFTKHVIELLLTYRKKCKKSLQVIKKIQNQS